MVEDIVEFCLDHHRCKNGSRCQEKADDPGSYGCDCSTATPTNLDVVYAGRYCDFAATEYCNAGNARSTISFCTNGKCRHQNGNAQQQHRGCNCNFGYTGAHCEFVGSISSTARLSPDALRSQKQSPILTSFLSISAVAIAGACFLVWRRRRRRNETEEVVDDDDSNNNSNNKKNQHNTSGRDLELEADGGAMPTIAATQTAADETESEEDDIDHALAAHPVISSDEPAATATAIENEKEIV